MSLYAEYLRERTDDKIIETDFGFATYRYIDDAVYIVDIYVKPANRKKGEASILADMIAEEAKDHGINKMLGTVATGTKGATSSLKVLLAYGFELAKTSPEGIILSKEI
jgi:GNAT superfamily N-acetyltransferase